MTRYALLAATILATAWSSVSVQAQPVSGIYIGAGGGANFLQGENSTFVTRGVVNGVPAVQSGRVRRDFDTGVTGVGSIGYGFGNGLRLEVEGDYRFNRRSGPNGTALFSAGGSVKKYGGMVNALFDLDIGSPYVFPYLGGGLGYQHVESRYNTRSTLLGATFATTNSNASEGAFAYQGIGGLAFPVPHVPGLSITTEYRFLGLAGYTNHDTTTGPGNSLLIGSDKVKRDYNHSLMLGVRYEFNPPPPPAAEPAPVTPAAAIRQYIVFFDWDRADLTDRARAIIASAAQGSRAAGVTRIEVDGNADASGTARYNVGLSERRARSVAAELVRDGVSASAISIRAFGDTHLLVPTARGVREPQNRRVEIIMR